MLGCILQVLLVKRISISILLLYTSNYYYSIIYIQTPTNLIKNEIKRSEDKPTGQIDVISKVRPIYQYKINVMIYWPTCSKIKAY